MELQDLMPKIMREGAAREHIQAQRTAGLNATLRVAPGSPAGAYEEEDEIDTANPRGYNR